jgi:phospholipase D
MKVLFWFGYLSLLSAVSIDTYQWYFERGPYACKPVHFEACFTPGQMCEDLIIKKIKESHKSILVQAYQLTSIKIVNALLEKARKGDKIVLILDRTAKEAALPLIWQGIPVYIDDRVKIAHNKVMIIDDHILITGSFNFTSSAENRNAENLLIVDNEVLAHEYKVNFYDRLRQSVPIGIYNGY